MQKTFSMLIVKKNALLEVLRNNDIGEYLPQDQDNTLKLWQEVDEIDMEISNIKPKYQEEVLYQLDLLKQIVCDELEESFERNFFGVLKLNLIDKIDYFHKSAINRFDLEEIK